MTEAEWLESDEPLAMLRARGDQLSQRQMRLLALACCRKVWRFLIDKMSRDAVELAERSVDEPISYEELDLVSGGAEGAFEDSLTDDEGVNRSEGDPIPGAAAAASYASSPGLLDLDNHMRV